MNILEIFGICFIVELCLIISAIIVSIIMGKIDLITKKDNYKKMMELEKELKNKKVAKDNKEEAKEMYNNLQEHPEILNELLKKSIEKDE